MYQYIITPGMNSIYLLVVRDEVLISLVTDLHLDAVPGLPTKRDLARVFAGTYGPDLRWFLVLYMLVQGRFLGISIGDSLEQL